MNETEALASERKALAREVRRSQRSVADLSQRVKATRGDVMLRSSLSDATAELHAAQGKLTIFDLKLANTFFA